MTIQAQIDALPATGGKIIIPTGDFSAEPSIVMRDNVILEGQGYSTIIPPVSAGGNTRREALTLRDLVVDGVANPGYAIDWRNVSAAKIDSVKTRNCTYGLLLDYTAYYAEIRSLFVEASVCAVEAYGGANQNTFIGGRWSAPLGFNHTGTNGITMVGVSLEGPDPAMNFVQGVVAGMGIKFVNVRNEKPGYGPIWLNN